MKTKLSRLQQEFFEVVVEFVKNHPNTMAAIEAVEEWDVYMEGLRKDIASMNAAELRHNIKIWKEK